MDEMENNDNNCDSKGKKKPRRRMKALYGKIREQMEFYFSDANLHKDRFLKKAIEATKDGYIDLATFLKFNRIKAITGDVAVLADAVSTTSNFLQLNEDRTKVRRTTPIEEPKNIDERTVYVEHLPHSVDHEWVKRLFSSCGKVAYVSLPRYPSTGDLKGFAFVEFETIEGAEKACQELNNPPADSFSSVGMFPKSNTQLEKIKKKLPEEQIEATKEKAKELIMSEKPENEQNNQPQSERDKQVQSAVTEAKSRRRRTTSEGSTDGAVPSKRRKQEVSFDEQKNVETEKTGGAKKKSRKRKSRSKTVDSVASAGEMPKTEDSELDTSSEVVPEKKLRLEDSKDGSALSGDTEEKKDGNKEMDAVTKGSQDSVKKKKKRSRKRKPRKEKEITEMRVIPKKEWLSLREEYLHLQKTSMSLLKKTLGEVKQQNTEETATKEKKKAKDIQYVPGVIVKVSSENQLSRKAVKECLGEEVEVAYVDVTDGLLEGHIRCRDNKSAESIVASTPEGYTFALVTGEEEKRYWDKLLADREAKYSSKCRHKKRGHDKWMEKAQRASIDTVERKHITFDDD